jgi:PKD repeat protein
MLRLLFAMAISSTGCLIAQTLQTAVIPAPYTATEAGTSVDVPWAAGSVAHRVQYIYDGSFFAAAGLNGPVRITNIRWRADGGATQLGYTYQNVILKLSTCPHDYSAMSLTFANNHGGDVATVYSGPVVVNTPAGTSPNSWFVSIAITPFVYDPTIGDLTVDVALDGVGGAGHSVPNTPRTDCVGFAGTPGAWAYNVTNWQSPTATRTQNGIAPVIELTFQRLGLFAGFAAAPTSGLSPLTVSFTDQSISSDPGGITSWAWDFDGDSVIDSTVQNPTFVYAGCGDYTVSLTVTDASHAPSRLSRTSYVTVDPGLTAGFTYSGSNGVVQFTDTYTPTPTSWAWDLDGDGVVDSTAQNPTWTYPSSCAATTVTLTAQKLCRTSSARRAVVSSPYSVATPMAMNNQLSGNPPGHLFDISVTNPQGIVVCAVTVLPWSFSTGAFAVGVMVTPGTYVGNQRNIDAWRQVGSGLGTKESGFTLPVVVPMRQPFYLPPGNYGMAVYIANTMNPSGGFAPIGPFSTPEVTLFPSPSTAPGIMMTGLFSGTEYAGYTWSGAIHYTTPAVIGEPGYGFFGAGCPGSLGIPGLTPTSLPRLGQTFQVRMDRLPLSAAIMIIGFSNTMSSVGPLPLDLTSLGAPGCFGRVSPDASMFVLGSANAAVYAFNVPGSASLLAMQFYHQALVIDPAVNGLGAVMSDAVAAILGN